MGFLVKQYHLLHSGSFSQSNKTQKKRFSVHVINGMKCFIKAQALELIDLGSVGLILALLFIC